MRSIIDDHMRKANFHPSKKALFSSLAILGVVGMALSAPPKTRMQSVDACSTKPVNSATAIKTYHLRDNTDGFNIVPTKDGGYLLSGDTLAASGMAVPNPFVVKVNSLGAVSWSRQFSSQSLPPRSSLSSHEPHLAAETTDGGLVIATDIVDGKFIDADYEANLKEVGDVLVTKTNSKGTQLWSITFGDYSLDWPQKIWALPDGGVMLLSRFANTDHEPEVADMDAVAKYSVLAKIDKNGKIVSTKKMGWEAVDMQRLDDGSYIALANIDLPRTDQETAVNDIPTVIRLKSDLSTAWAKSMEMIPSEYNTPTVSAEGALTMKKTTLRIMGGDFKAVNQTPDGGFLALGFANLLLTKGLSGGVLGPITAFTPQAFIAVKFDAGGYYKWAKKITTDLVSGGTAIDFHAVKTADGNFVILQDIVRDSAGINAKYQYASEHAADAAALKAMTDAWAANIGLTKIDAEANPMWIKQIDAERNLTGLDIAPTVDKGVVVSGDLITTKERMTLSGMEPYKEAVLIKVDVNGGVSGCVGATDHRDAATEDQSQYLISQDMTVSAAEDMALNINKKVTEKVWTIKNTARTVCQYKKTAVTPACAYLTPTASTPDADGQPAVTPAAKTWALINYENTAEATVEGEKNATVHAELLPILKQVFGDQVKVKDNMKSMWLTYIFPRLVTRADVEAVQKKYEELGYKIDESSGGTLFVSRVGLTIHMTFSITSLTFGKLEVLL